MILTEMLDLQAKIMNGWSSPNKTKRMIEKWNLADDNCAMRGIKVPFDA
jgi:hypothetical protein